MLDALELDPFVKLSKDLRTASITLSANEARYLVDAYYSIQGYRIRFANQVRALSKSDEPHEVLRWMWENSAGLEKNVQRALHAYSQGQTVGEWATTILGIGPVLASGLLAHIDIKKAPTVGHIWSFAGLNPEMVWEKGQKRPWNADLKRLCWLIGESFIKVQNSDRDIYGHVYAERKKLEQEANDVYYYAEQAELALQKKKYGKDTEAYKAYIQGKLPPAHIHARARRYAVKLFLSHLHAVWYEVEYGRKPPFPYVIEHLGHAHLIKPPFWPLPDKEKRDAEMKEEVLETGEDALDHIVWEDEEEGEQGQEQQEERTPRKAIAPSLATKLARFKEQVERRNNGNH